MKQRKNGGKAVKVLIIIAIVIAVIAVGVFALLKATFLKSFPVLKGEPEIGKWYEVTVDGAKSSARVRKTRLSCISSEAA